MKPLIAVACAIIEHKGMVLVVQRSAKMAHPHQWEFPGGKLESNERACDCIIREIKEELGIEIRPLKELSPTEHSPIQLIPFICSWTGGELQLHEHANACWLKEDDFPQLDWCPADIPVWKEYLQYRHKN